MLRRLALLAVLILLAPVAAVAAAPLPAPQDSQEFGRLSQDQAKLAEQVRRLERLLETLEQREREQGNPTKAELLRSARLRLQGLEGSTDLAAAIETVANSLSEMRSGAALEAQAELIEQLQSLLDFLLQEHLENQLQAMLDAARQQVAQLDAMVQRQQELIDQLRAMQRSQGRDAESPSEAGESTETPPADAQTGEPPPEAGEGEQTDPGEAGEAEDGEREPGEESGEAEEEPPADADELAERQAELRQEIEEMLRKAEAGRSQQSLEEAEQRSEQAEKQLGEQDLQAAEEQMQKAKEALEQARDQAEARQDQAEQREQLEDLINLMVSAQGLLDRPLAVEEPLLAFISDADGRRPSRRDHARLRGWAEAEQQISDDTAALLIEVDLGGAAMFPFLLQVLADDHRRLARDVGPPRYRAGESQAETSRELSGRWKELIDAIQTEMERVRKQLEAPGGQQQGGQEEGEEDQNQSLVTFAEELQLLKRVQEDLGAQLKRYAARRRALAESGLELDQDDLDQIDRLIERQTELRQVYDAILERLRQEQGSGGEEDA